MRGAGGHSRGLGNLALARLVAAAWVAGGGATALAEPGRAGDPPWLGPAFSAPAAALAEAAGRIPAPPNADLEVLLEEGRHVFAADGSARFAYRQVYRVLTPAGLSKGGVTRAVWTPWTEAPPRVRARVVSPNGGEVRLDPDTLAVRPVTGPDPGIFIDRKALEGPLPGMSVGVVVEEETVWRTQAPTLHAGALRSWYLGSDVPVRLSRLTVEAPRGVPLRFEARGTGGGVTKTTDAGMTTLRFEGGPYPPATEPPPGLPPDVARQPRVAYATGRSWAAIADAYSQVVDRQLEGADLSKLVEVAGTARTAGEQVRTALAEVHRRVRYTGVHFGEHAIVPATPAQTLGRGYGDCKDKSTLLVGVLRGLGLDAHVALVRAAPSEDVRPRLPALSAFDHAIVRVREPPMWIDPSDRFAAAGELPAPVMGRRALIAASRSAGLVSIPGPSATDNVTREVVEFALAPFGPPSASLGLTMTGAFKRRYRAHLRAAGPAEAQEDLQAYAADRFGLQEATCDFGGTATPSDPQEVRMRARRSSHGDTDKDGAYVAVSTLGLFADLPPFLAPGEEPPPPRLGLPVRLATPHCHELTLRVRPGPGLTSPVLPVDEDLRWGTAILTRRSTANGAGGATVALRFCTGGPRMTPGEAEDLRLGAAEYAARPPLTVRYDSHAAVALAAGRYGEAIRGLRAIAEAHPEVTQLGGQLIGALLAAGYGDAARRRAATLAARDPTDALSQQFQGWALQHDLIGRNLAAGMDRPGALSAYRRAHALDPLNPRPLPYVCDLLERDDAGQRYTAAVDLTAAVACRLSLPRPVERVQDAVRTLRTLARAGRFEQLIVHANQLPHSHAGDALLVAATALTEGVARADEAATRLVATPQARRALQDETRKALFRLGRYPEAMAWIDRVGAGPHLALAEVRRLRSLRRRPASSLAASPDPADAWRAVTALWMSPNYDRRRILERFTPSLRSRLAHRRRFDDLVGAWPGWVRGRPGADLVAAVSADLAMAEASPRSLEGGPKRGWRLRVGGSMGEVGTLDTYVVPTADGPRIAAVDRWVEAAGDEALARLRVGDQAVADALLRWAADVVGGATAPPPHAAFLSALAARPPASRALVAALLAGPDSEAADDIERATATLGGRDEEEPWSRQGRAVRAAALARLGRFGEVAEILPSEPTELTPVEATLRLEALRRLGAGAKAQALLGELLGQTAPSDRVLRWAWDQAASMGSFERADAIRRRLFKVRRPQPADLVGAAWRSLFRPVEPGTALRWARRANAQLDGRDPEGLLTEALLRAAGRDPQRARSLRDQARAQRPGAPAGPRLWLVQGRLAWSEGLHDLARVYLERAAQPPPRRADDPSTLARRWLRQLSTPAAE